MSSVISVQPQVTHKQMEALKNILENQILPDCVQYGGRNANDRCWRVQNVDSIKVPGFQYALEPYKIAYIVKYGKYPTNDSKTTISHTCGNGKISKRKVFRKGKSRETPISLCIIHMTEASILDNNKRRNCHILIRKWHGKSRHNIAINSDGKITMFDVIATELDEDEELDEDKCPECGLEDPCFINFTRPSKKRRKLNYQIKITIGIH